MDTPTTPLKQAALTLRLISSKPAPMKTHVEAEKEQREPIAYRFDVVRDDIGRIVQIIMTPLERE